MNENQPVEITGINLGLWNIITLTVYVMIAQALVLGAIGSIGFSILAILYFLG